MFCNNLNSPKIKKYIVLFYFVHIPKTSGTFIRSQSLKNDIPIYVASHNVFDNQYENILDKNILKKIKNEQMNSFVSFLDNYNELKMNKKIASTKTIKYNLKYLKDAIDYNLGIYSTINDINEYTFEDYKIKVDRMSCTHFIPLINKMIKITIVRNPYDILTSLYFHNKTMGFNSFNKIYKIKNFKHFIKVFCDDNTLLPIRCWQKSIFGQLFDKKGKCQVDLIIVYENRNKAFDILNKYINGCVIDENKYKYISGASVDKTKDYTKYYDDETKKIVYKKFKKDFELFQYNFNGHIPNSNFIIPDDNFVLF